MIGRAFKTTGEYVKETSENVDSMHRHMENSSRKIKSITKRQEKMLGRKPNNGNVTAI